VEKSEVCKRLRKFENQKRLIDEDPFSVQPRYMKKECEVYKIYQITIFKILKNHPNNKLIVPSPRLEKWVLLKQQNAPE